MPAAFPRVVFSLTCLWLLSVPGISSTAADPESEYVGRIKPLLKDRCLACHGGLKQQAGLRLDTGRGMISGGDGGPAIVPGKPDESPLMSRVSAQDAGERMPPDGEPLTPEQIATLRAWIAAGAEFPADERPEQDPRDHWAFRPVVRPEIPQVERRDWVRNPIDAFVGREHERRDLLPQTEAARSLLIRRLYLDLLGVPPSSEELQRLAADDRDGWYERLADELLEDPRHGERWARHWMDVWRYSDWWGLGNQLRNSRQHIHHWRDWIVESVNADTPYDEMVRLMLAADEMAPEDPNRLRATGFLARNFFLFNRHQWMDETVEHVGKAFLGLTMNCVKCHDHKYDPFDQIDYYRLRAFFEPYHVRTDIIPGQIDLNVDGIPRAFDALPDEPTYLFVRGDENRPDKSQVIAPGLPDLLEFEDLKIDRVALPAVAWQPERRPGVIDAYLAAARGRIESAEQRLAAGRKRLDDAKIKADKVRIAAADSSPPATKETPTSSLRIMDDFAKLDIQRWRVFGGNWEFSPGRLEQKLDGAQRAGLRLLDPVPRDFDLTLRYTLVGGSRWRSVSVGFDATAADPAASENADDHEQFVYLSGVQGGAKVQAAYRQAGNTVYPPDGMRPLPMELNREYVFRVRVRDTLINASVDGKPVLAWRSPVPRRDGALQLTTFDALAVFHEVRLSELSPNEPLQEPTAKPNSEPMTPEQGDALVADATAELRLEESALAVAQADLQGWERRAEALRAQWALNDAAAPQDTLREQERDRRHAAVLAERTLAVAKGRQAVADAELRLLRAAADKQEAVAQELKSAQETLKKAEAAEQAEVTPTDTFAPIAGAMWSPTRFRSSGADDPTLTFPAESSGRRSALAKWITDPRNPLAARVAVNHIWMRHLGTPLVASVFEFGRHGTPPTHPELLDWLAAEFVESGWSMKHLHRLIVTSATYRLDSSVVGREANQAGDRDNLFYWRRAPVRLESQLIRDSLLALAGTIDWKQGGPSIPAAEQAESKRRSLYFFHSNNEQNAFLSTFDEARVTECYRRERSIVPQQALAMSNSRLVIEAAGPIADRIVSAAGVDDAPEGDAAFMDLAFVLLLGAPPTDAEIAAGRRALDAWRRIPDATPRQARTHFVWALLNHNDFVTIR